MLKWLKRKLAEHKRHSREEAQMKRFGCVLFCYKCGEILDQPAVKADTARALYSYRCTCGACCTFNFDFPAPLKVSEDLLP